MHPGLRAVLLTAATLVAAVPASAQILVLDTEVEGDLGGHDADAFRATLAAGLDRAAPGDVLDATSTRAAIGDLAACDAPECAAEIGRTTSASVAVYGEVYAEAEIYDFTVRV